MKKKLFNKGINLLNEHFQGHVCEICLSSCHNITVVLGRTKISKFQVLLCFYDNNVYLVLLYLSLLKMLTTQTGSVLVYILKEWNKPTK